MTKEEALRYKENWAVVHQVMIDEARCATPEERLQSLSVLYWAAQAFGWSQRLRADDDAVRNRWQRLKDKFSQERLYD